MTLAQRVRVLCFAVSALPLAHAAAAAPNGLIYRDTPDTPADFQAQRVLADDSGYWMLGLANGKGALARYANDATLQYIRYDDYGIGSYGNDALAAPDGGMFLTSATFDFFGDPACDLRRTDAAGAVLWSRQFAGFFGAPCPLLGVDGAGAVWLLPVDGTYRVSADGGSVAGPAPDLNGSRDFAYAVDPVLTQGYWISSAPEQANPTYASLFSIDAGGHVHAMWHAGDLQITFNQLISDRSGNLYAFGSDGSNVFAASFTRAGTLRWSGSFADSGTQSLVAAAGFGSGGAAALDAAGHVYLTDANGPVRSVALPQFSSCAVPERGVACALATTPARDAIVMYNGGSATAAAMLARVHGDGSVQASALGTAAVGSAVALADGSALAGPLLDAGTGGLLPKAFVRYASGGTALAAPQPQAAVRVDGSLVAAAQARDGSEYLLANAPAGPGYTLTRVDPNGARIWKRSFAGGYWIELHGFALDGDRVCWAGAQQIDIDHVTSRAICHAAANGDPQWSYALPAGSQFLAFEQLADGAAESVYLGPYPERALHQVQLDAGGTVVGDHALGSFYEAYADTVSINRSGMTVLCTYVAGGQNIGLFGWSRDGSSLFVAHPPVQAQTQFSQVPEFAVLDADGTTVVKALFGTNDANNNSLWAVQPDGSTRWFKNLASHDYLMPGSIADGRLYAELADFQSADVARYRAQAIALADGRSLWTTELPTRYLIDGRDLGRGAYDSGLHVDAASGKIVQTLGGAVLQVLLFDPRTGQIERSIVQDCDTARRCEPYIAGNVSALSSDMTLRIATGSFDDAAGSQARVYALAATTPAPPLIPAGQSGIDGVWYAPYEAGQGFTIDFFASNRALFMAWFTFDRNGGNTPAAQTWYTLQGSVAPGASGADLALAAADPGAFGSGYVGVRQVGTAFLSFSDCHRGTLSYQFDADTNRGAAGLIDLHRLTESTAMCDAATDAAADNSAPPADGFDALQSGSWFDPANPGQGIEMTIIPRGNGSNGFAFLAWFTFDPLGYADDPSHRHWFTLQGDLSAAAAGHVTLPIVHTIGGTFDLVPTGNSYRVGAAQLTLHGCDSATLDYTFDSSEVAYAFSGASGSIPLQRIGGCAVAP